MTRPRNSCLEVVDQNHDNRKQDKKTSQSKGGKSENRIIQKLLHQKQLPSTANHRKPNSISATQPHSQANHTLQKNRKTTLPKQNSAETETSSEFGDNDLGIQFDCQFFYFSGFFFADDLCNWKLGNFLSWYVESERHGAETERDITETNRKLQKAKR